MFVDFKKKKIILLVDDYVPDSTKVAAKMMHELAIEFIERGHDVTVITPSSTVSRKSTCNIIDGVEVIQFRLGRIKNCSLALRAINETLLPFNAWRNTGHILKGKSFDLIVSYSPSIFWGRFTAKLKSLYNCPVYLILRDFFPQWIIDKEMIRPGSFIATYFRYFERLNYGSADRIGIQSIANIKYFKKCFGNSYPVSLLYNWADPRIDDKRIKFKEGLGIQNKVLFFYGGNLGKAQDMANLVRLAHKFKNFPQAHFVFLGQGDEFDLINEMVNQYKMSNVSLLPPVSQDTFKQILKEVDVGLFSLSRDHQSHNFPGKILGYMVNTIPILGSVNKGNDLQSVINEYEAGFVIENGEDDLLFNKAQLLLQDSVMRKQAGLNAVRLLNDKFTVAAAANEILSIYNDQG